MVILLCLLMAVDDGDNCDHDHLAGDLDVVHLFSGGRSAVLTMVTGKKSAWYRECRIFGYSRIFDGESKSK